MVNDKALIRDKMIAWEEQLNSWSLPAWEDFPALPLYMDQVIYLLNGYLRFPAEEEAENSVTPAMINNYVKLKIIPPPVKKRYGKLHLAYLMMVCALKQTVSTAEIRKIVPLGLDEAAARTLYEGFRAVFLREREAFRQAVRQAARPVLAGDNEPAAHLVFHAAAEASLYQMLAERLLNLDAPEKNDA